MQRGAANRKQMPKRVTDGQRQRRRYDRRKIRQIPAEQKPKTAHAAQIHNSVYARYARPHYNGVKQQRHYFALAGVCEIYGVYGYRSRPYKRKQHVPPHRVGAVSASHGDKHDRRKYRGGQRAGKRTVEPRRNLLHPSALRQNMTKRARRKDESGKKTEQKNSRDIDRPGRNGFEQ